MSQNNPDSDSMLDQIVQKTHLPYIRNSYPNCARLSFHYRHYNPECHSSQYVFFWIHSSELSELSETND